MLGVVELRPSRFAIPRLGHHLHQVDRYELQTLQPVWPERLVKMVTDLRQLEENIGADHDLVVLKRSLLKTPDAFGGVKAVERVVGPLNEKSKQLRREAEPLGKAIFDQTSRRFVRELGQHWSKWREMK